MPSPQDLSQNQITTGDCLPVSVFLGKMKCATVNMCACQEEKELDDLVSCGPSHDFERGKVEQVSEKTLNFWYQ